MAHELNILIVEDDQVAAFIYQVLFKRYTYYIDIVESAELGLEKFH